MQTKSIILTSTIATLALAAPQQSSDMPTLGGPNWYDWSAYSSAPVAVASSSSAASPVAQSSWAPAWTPSASTTWAAWTPSAPAAAVSTSTSSYKYENPFTVYTSMTNSWGVITGMPSVVTSQPAVVTSQPAVVTPVAVTSQAPKYQNSTLTKSSATGTGFQQSASATIAVHTGAAVVNAAGGASFAVAVLGFVLSIL